MSHDVLGRFVRASSLEEKKMLESGDSELDAFLSGGLPIGGISAWSATLGIQAREIIIKWVKRIHSHEKRPVLWIVGVNGLEILASTWASHGVDLSLMYFANCTQPLQEMREVFLSHVFPLIVIDGLMLSPEDQAFLVSCARLREQSIVLLENHRAKASSWHPTVRHRVQVKALDHGVELIRNGSSLSLSFD